MIVSGYVPQSASARDGRASRPLAPTPAGAGAAADASGALPRTVAHPVVDVRPYDPGEDAAAAPDGEPVVPAYAEEPIGDEAADDGAYATATDEVDQADPSGDAGTWPVLADAGPDRVIWGGWNEATLDGGASAGEGLRYAWRQIDGPFQLDLQAGGTAKAKVAGLAGTDGPSWHDRTFTFELTTTDAQGQTDVDTVNIIVKSAPALSIKPAARRRFENRDGFELAHFESWITNLESYDAVFEIRSESDLNFTKVSGAACDISGGKSDAGYLYYVVVYGQPGDSSAWVEFLVDNEERIPGIVQLGVNWEER